jgi:hypothetical protein
MSEYRQQALIEAPVESIWELVGNPQRHPEWWPRVIEVRGERFRQDDEYVQITRGPVGQSETRFLIDKVEDLREIRMHCTMSGTYAHWLLTGAQGGTFLDVAFGAEPMGMSMRVFDATYGRIFYRRWLADSLAALRQAAQPRAAASA